MNTRRFHLGLLALLLLVPLFFGAKAYAAPERRASVVDLAVTGGASICTSSLTPTFPHAAIRVFVGVKSGATDSVFKLVLTTSNGGTITLALNSATALTAGSGYGFTVLIPYGCTYNFTLSTSTTLGALVVEEVPGDAI